MSERKTISGVTVREKDTLYNHPNVGKLVEFLEKYWDIQAKPHGYDELRKGYTDFDGMEEFDPTEMLESFKGFESSTAGSFSFPEQLSAPQVVYGEVCQGRSPLHSIASAIFSYAFQCGAKHQELKYVESFEGTTEHYKKMIGIIDRTEKPEQQAKSFRGEVIRIIKDIKHKLYFDSEVTDHTKLDEVMDESKELREDIY